MSQTPVVSNLLIANVVAYLATMLLDTNDMYALFALFPVGSPFFEVWQPLTYMFLHGDFSHLFFNMFALWMFGRTLEYDLGSKRFLTYYMVCGIGAALLQLGVGYAEFMHSVAETGLQASVRLQRAMKTQVDEIAWEMTVARATPATSIWKKRTKIQLKNTLITPAMERKIKGCVVFPAARRIEAP